MATQEASKASNTPTPAVWFTREAADKLLLFLTHSPDGQTVLNADFRRWMDFLVAAMAEGINAFERFVPADTLRQWLLSAGCDPSGVRELSHQYRIVQQYETYCRTLDRTVQYHAQREEAIQRWEREHGVPYHER